MPTYSPPSVFLSVSLVCLALCLACALPRRLTVLFPLTCLSQAAHPSRAVKTECEARTGPTRTRARMLPSNIHRPKPPFSADGPGRAPQLQRRPIWTRSSPTVPRTPTWLFSARRRWQSQQKPRRAKILSGAPRTASFRRGTKRISKRAREKASRARAPADRNGKSKM